ncbi:Helix-turn-helix domain-containing protein [Acinetobacter marinus]|uniref:Helix-turn-helix domain-containing protein n=1 Tax=Acinetobacter marinus TaxID=281375 RepID=A0A1G6IEU4_9GAMM|nr:AraC family transcriptional regulator [Acinetobacter marinus]SDC05077.1 Helix-turn-helix domain-containing protein [Acinetobacter marinus]
MQNQSIHSISISIDFVHAAISKLTLSQQQIDHILQQCRISTALLDHHQARVTLRQYAELITALTVATRDELLGHSQTISPLGSLAVLMHWLISSKDMHQALQRMTQYYQMIGKGFDISLQIKDDKICAELIGGFQPYQEPDAFIFEFGFFFIHRILCWLSRDILPIRAIDFPFTEPSYASDYRLMFYGTPIRFGQASAQMIFDRHCLNLSVNQSMQSLQHLLSDPFTQLLILNFQDRSWSAKVAECLQNAEGFQFDQIKVNQKINHEMNQAMHPMATLDQVATYLKLAPYTLQRRLQDEGQSFLAIKNQVKRDRAIELLVSSRMSIEQISLQLGFAETSPFTRSFKQWTGVAPSAYRKHKNS